MSPLPESPPRPVRHFVGRDHKTPCGLSPDGPGVFTYVRGYADCPECLAGLPPATFTEALGRYLDARDYAKGVENPPRPLIEPDPDNPGKVRKASKCRR